MSDPEDQTRIADLPVELLERIFVFVSSDIDYLKSLSTVCQLFRRVICKVRDIDMKMDQSVLVADILPSASSLTHSVLTA